MLPSRLLKLSACLLLPIATLFLILNQQPATASAWESKVDPLLVEAYRSRSGAEIEMIIRLEEQADLSQVADLPTKEARGEAVFAALTAVANTSQAELRQLLDDANLPYKAFPIANALWVQAPTDQLPLLAQRSEVAYILANPRVSGDLPEPLTEPQARAALAVAWGVEKINAPLVWSSGVTGTGIVIGGQDTGYDWEHPALKNRYRGWDGNSADHNYNWHDAISSDLSGNSTNPCGYSLTAPCDDDGHGTHTMGTMVGDDEQGMQIGVAPGATWIACRNMEQGYGTPATYLECFNWFLAPTDLNGLNPNPALAPHVINNSWACTLGEGCDSGNYSVMDTAINNLRAAGIVVVASAGNYGPSCETVRTPAAIYEGAFTIGNTQSTDVVNASSSRGPVTVDGSQRMKPDVMAPGTSIPSAYLNDGYVSLTGTSMSGPHVAGALALLMAAKPALQGDVDALETLLETTAVPSPPPQTCGDDTLSSIPNNVYGHGRIDVYAAFQQIVSYTLSLDQSVSATTAKPADILTYTLTLTHGEAPTSTTDIAITQTLPAGTSFISATQPVTLSGETLMWSFSSLAPTSTLEVSFTVQISPTGTPGDIVLPPTTFSSADVPASSSGGNLRTMLLLNYQFLPVIHRP